MTTILVAPRFLARLPVNGYLHSWTIAYNGAETVRAETIDRFAEAFVTSGFRRSAFFPCYGLAEATLFVSGGPVGEEPRRRYFDVSALESNLVSGTELPTSRYLVGSGRPTLGTKVLAVNPATRLEVSNGQVGELWVQSPSVGSGYFGREQESTTAFKNYLACGAGPFLSTGDLGFLDKGDVFVTGRSKDLIIIRGRNIYPEDVESRIENMVSSVRANTCAAFSIHFDGNEHLGMVIEADRTIASAAKNLAVDVEEISLKIQGTVAREFDVRLSIIVLVKPGTFPRTSSGKVQRRACRNGFLDGTLDTVYKWCAWDQNTGV